MNNFHNMIPDGIMELTRNDIKTLYNTDNSWYKWIVKKTSLTYRDEFPPLPRQFIFDFDKTILNYNDGAGKYGRGFAIAELTLSKNAPQFSSGSAHPNFFPASIGLDCLLKLTSIYIHFTGNFFNPENLLKKTAPEVTKILECHNTLYYIMNVFEVNEEESSIIFESHIAADQPDNIVYNFKLTKISFSTKGKVKAKYITRKLDKQFA